jgi:hypothetical protein
MIDASIPLRAKAPNVGNALFQATQAADQHQLVKERLAASKQQRQGNALFNAGRQDMMQEQLKGQQLKNEEMERRRLQNSYVNAALRTKAHIENNDIAGLERYYTQRAEEIHGRGGDPSETLEALDMLRNGDIDGLMAGTNSVIQAAQQGGLIAAKDPRTSAMKEFELAQKNPEFAEYQQSLKRSGATKINNTISQANKAGLTEEQKALAKSRVSRFEQVQGAAQAAMDQNEQLEQLSQIDVDTGFGEEAKTQVARVFNSFGVNGDSLLGVDVANAQAFRASSGKLLAEALAAQKGPQTDKDAERIMDTLPKLTNEQEANKFILRSMKAINQRKIEQAEFYERALEVDGTLKNADSKWREFKRKTPLMSGSIINQSTGLPMFFGEFMDQAKERNPGATRQQIIGAWRKINGGA